MTVLCEGGRTLIVGSSMLTKRFEAITNLLRIRLFTGISKVIRAISEGCEIIENLQHASPSSTSVNDGNIEKDKKQRLKVVSC